MTVPFNSDPARGDAGPRDAASGDAASGDSASVNAARGESSVRRRDERHLAVWMWAALVVATIARVAWLGDKPFWRDEAWVALLVDDPMSAATDGRAVPLGFLFLTRLLAALPAAPEITYRLFPLLCGIALLPVLWKLTLVLGQSRRTAVAVAWLAAGIQPFIYYSRELKSYQVDLLLAALVPLLALVAFDREKPQRPAQAGLFATMIAAPWLSFGAIFPICAMLAWGWLAGWGRGASGERRSWIACTLAFVASFAAVYVLALGNQSSDPWMQAYWRYYLGSDNRFFLPLRMIVALWNYCSISTTYIFRDLWPAAVFVAAVGAWTWPRPQRRFLVFYYFGTAAFCAAAASIDRYLLVNGRHLLFAVPVLLLWVANGLNVFGARAGALGATEDLGVGHRIRRLIPAAVALGIPVILALAWSAQAVDHRIGRYRTNSTNFFRFDVLEDVDGAIEAGEKLIRDGEPLLVSRKCAYAFQFYNEGRLHDATYCRRHCADFFKRAEAWLAKLDGPGWMMVGEEDRRSFGRFLDEQGFAYRQRAEVKGVKLWRVTRVAVKPSKRGARTKSQSTKTPTTTWPQ